MIAIAIGVVIIGIAAVALLFGDKRNPDLQATEDIAQVASLCGDAEAEAYADYLTAKQAHEEEKERELIA